MTLYLPPGATALPSSGFQSDQFRTVEYLLGLKDAKFIAYQADRPEARAALETALHAPSLWDEAIAAASRAGMEISPEVLERMHGGEGQALADGEWPGFSRTFLRAVDSAMIIRPAERPQTISEWLALFTASMQ